MLGASDTPIEQAVEELGEFGVDAAYLVPTDTGLRKSICDAHVGLRAFLKDRKIHDYEGQGQGEEAKVFVPIDLVGADGLKKTKVSMYRPFAKPGTGGDPRLWVWGLKGYAKPNNLLAFITDADGALFLVNCSDPALMASRNIEGTPLNQLLTAGQSSSVAQELLDLLRGIRRLGFVQSMRPGDTGVGFTLESLLGIRANSSRLPDYKGIEIKAYRGQSGGRRVTRKKNLFSQKPDWSRSRLSAAEILDEFGYDDPATGRRQLYCTVAPRPNPQGLYLIPTNDEELIENLAVRGAEDRVKVVQWSTQALQSALSIKHKETFWVKASNRSSPSGAEEFRYEEVLHTRAPLVHNFAPLVATGVISMDYTLSLRDTGTVRDHGYLFKISPAHHQLLFPDPVKHVLQ